MKRGFSSQTLVHNSTYAPQICLGIIVLRHNDLGSLCSNKWSSQLRSTVTSEPVPTEHESYHVHGRATQCGSHGVGLEVPRKPKISCRFREIKRWVNRLSSMQTNALHNFLEWRCRLKPLPILTLVLMELDLRPSGWQSKMFWGLRSLWRMPLLCRTFMAWAICCRNTRIVSSLSAPLAVGERDKTTYLRLYQVKISRTVYRFIDLHIKNTWTLFGNEI